MTAPRNIYDHMHLHELLQKDKEEMESVFEAIRAKETLAENVNDSYEETLTFGQRVADKIATFWWSWNFIIIFLSILTLWMIGNVIMGTQAFDPYPFILLNLCLSCVAALQAPVIMMSQNRQETRDRIRAENDYKVNLKAEVEIRSLHDKIDHLLMKKWDHLIEIQQIQLEILEGKRPSSRSSHHESHTSKE